MIRDIRRTARKMMAPFFAFVAFAYFAYHLIQGDHGLLSWRLLTQKLKADKASLEQVEEKRAVLENKVKLLNPKSLDLDMLDERVRSMLNFHDDNDIVVVDK